MNLERDIDACTELQEAQYLEGKAYARLKSCDDKDYVVCNNLYSKARDKVNELSTKPKKVYTLDELLKDAPSTPPELTAEDREWIDAPPMGKEIL